MDAYGAYCKHTRSAGLRIHERIVYKQREREMSLSYTMPLQLPVQSLLNRTAVLNNPALIQILFCVFAGVI